MYVCVCVLLRMVHTHAPMHKSSLVTKTNSLQETSDNGSAFYHSLLYTKEQFKCQQSIDVIMVVQEAIIAKEH